MDSTRSPLPQSPFSLLATVVLATVVVAVDLAAQAPDKPAPASRAVHVDWKTGPAEPWVPPAAPDRRATASRTADKNADAGARSVALDPFADPTTILFDTPIEGTVIVAAASYKAEFAAGEVRFVPFLGSAASRDWPLGLHLGDVTIAGEPLPLRTAPEPIRQEDVVSFDHGTAVVRYAVRSEGVEQSFVFSALPRRGELRIQLEVDSDLNATSEGSSLRFAGPDGGVDYGTATAIDARGRRLGLARTLVDGRIELTVPADFVAAAALPLVVDPLITTATLHSSTSGRTVIEPDATYDGTSDRYMLCLELVYSATDSDIYSYEVDSIGNTVSGSFAAIDITSTESWQRPRIANNNIANRNLIVAQVSAGNVSPFWIGGRTRDVGSTTTGAPFIVSSAATGNVGDKLNPDVGGDPHLISPTYFTVTWERAYSSTDHDIHARQFTATSTPSPQGATEILIDNSSAYEGSPAISNSAGAPDPNELTQKWMIAYQRNSNEIRGRTMRWDGALDPDFLIHSRGTLGNPDVSTVTHPSHGEYLYLVAWTRTTIGPVDTSQVFVKLCSQTGTPLTPAYDLDALESGQPLGWNRGSPRVSTDGCRFAVAYTEDYRNYGDLDVRVTTLHAGFNEPAQVWGLDVTEGRAWPAYQSTGERAGGICSRFECADPGASGSARYFMTWSDDNSPGSPGIHGALYDGRSPGTHFTVLFTGCGAAAINATGNTTLGMDMTIATGTEYLLVGFPQPPVPLCPTFPSAACQIGIGGQPGLLPPSITITVPCDHQLIDLSLAFQGVSFLGGPCWNSVSVTDTVITTFR
ncbi:MAG: hypothetical protein IPM29_03640 [Planctomycetes bacterium]|nr:hypothetical protein [Planctomycetota bacterium]